ncbi:RNA-directed DNA polymerase (Reverse transcriptase), partial [Rhodopirellula maiorica SM1]
MTSEPPSAEQLAFDFVEADHAAANIPTDDSDLAAIEKSALGDDAYNLMEAIVDEVNMEMAWARVKANRGAPGPDGLTVEDFPEWFAPRWQNIRRQLLDGTYRPEPVRRKTILKPDGGTRELGIPNLLDRVIQTAIVLVLTPIFD